MAKKETETALTVITDTSSAIDVLNERLASLKKIHESVYKTKKKFDKFDLDTETNISNLIKMWASVQARAEAYDKAQHDLGIESAEPFKIEGSTADEWKSDILLRIQIIDQKQNFDQLNELKKDWEALMDKEDKKKLLLKKMEKMGFGS